MEQTAALAGGIIAFTVSAFAARNGIKNAVRDLEGYSRDNSDQVTAAARQTRQDVAGIAVLLVVANGLLGAILGVLLAPSIF